MAHSMRKEYDENGVEGFYLKHGATYRNKHGPEIKRVVRYVKAKLPTELSDPRTIRILDLACGSGESTLALVENKVAVLENVDACDPYTYAAFEEVCGKPAFRWSFEDIADGVLEDVPCYNLTVCSFALHLLDVSKLFGCCYQLALKSNYLLLLSPHKRPEIKPEMGWEFLFEIVEDRIHAKLFRSRLLT
jgi:SAM-dependent methyltransferase